MRFTFKTPLAEILAAEPMDQSEARFLEEAKTNLDLVDRFTPERSAEIQKGTTGDLAIAAKFIRNGRTPPRKDTEPAKAEPAPARAATPPKPAPPVPAPAPKQAEPWRPNRAAAVKIAARIFGPTGATVVDREPSDRAALDTLDRLLWQGHLTAPWLDRDALAAKYWRPDSPTGLARSIRAERQRALDQLLESLNPTTPKK